MVISAIGEEVKDRSGKAGDRNIKMVGIDLLKPHEGVDADRLVELSKSIFQEGLHYPVVADRKSQVVLDGHHRLEVFRRFGFSRIPVFYINYLDRKVVLRSWNGMKVTKKDVLRAAASGRLYPNKTTKHLFDSGEGVKHISSVVPRAHMKLFESRRKEGIRWDMRTFLKRSAARPL